MTSLSRNITLACGHSERLATLHRGERTAWCPVCESDVAVRHAGSDSAGPYTLVDLPCGCQDVHYADGRIDREHDHVECDGTPEPAGKQATPAEVHNLSCCMSGIRPGAGPHPDCPGVSGSTLP